MRPELRNHLSTHPFVSVDSNRIRTRAYYMWLNKSHPDWHNQESNWLAAEKEELFLNGGENLLLLYPDNTEIKEKFYMHYSLRTEHHFLPGLYDRQKYPKKFLGELLPDGRNKCALCPRTSDEVTFSKQSHVIPESFGNRILFSNEECDGCNQLYGEELENELAKMFQIDLALQRTPKKGTKTTKHKVRSGHAEVGGQFIGEELFVQTEDGNDSVKLDLIGPHEVRLSTSSPTFSPYNALRSVGKSIWLILDRKTREKYPEIIEWVVGSRAIVPFEFFCIFLPGTGFKKTGLAVWERFTKAENLYPLVCMFYFGNLVVCLGLPLRNIASLKQSQLLIPSMPGGSFPPHCPTGKHFVLSDASEKTRFENIQITFSHENRFIYHQNMSYNANIRLRSNTGEILNIPCVVRTGDFKDTLAIYKISIPDHLVTITLSKKMKQNELWKIDTEDKNLQSSQADVLSLIFGAMFQKGVLFQITSVNNHLSLDFTNYGTSDFIVT